MTSSANITLRLLSGVTPEMAELQDVLEASLTYTNRVTGLPVGPADAQSIYTMLPEGKSYDDKFVFGVFLARRMVGCIDLIRDYPEQCTAHIGLLLIAEPYQGQGIGRSAYCRLESEIRVWGTCFKIRIGVVRTNHAVVPFWQSLGFTRTGEVKPYRYGTVVSETVILTKLLNAATV